MIRPDDVIDRAVSLLGQIRSQSYQRTGFDSAFEIRTAEFALLIKRLSELEGLAPKRILEIGCGSGYSLLLWSLVADEVVGVDLPDVVSRTAEFLDVNRPAAGRRVSAVEGDIMTLGDIGSFDLVVSQYVLEHVADIGGALASVNRAMTPGGLAIHVVPGLTDRHAWYISYRSGSSIRRRLWDVVRNRRLAAILDPTVFTPPHAPEFGPFTVEHDEYRLERWALRFLKAGFSIVDYFQTRDVNWVFVTRRRERSG